MSEVSLRPYVPSDARRCAEIFRVSIAELAADAQASRWSAS